MIPTDPLLERLRALLAPRYADPVWIADGGMGVVYSATDTTLDRRVAVKVLAPEFATAAGAARFRRESKILARLAHPHIVPVYEAREADGLFLYIMAFVEGETLAARLRTARLSAAEVRVLGDHVLGALARAHREGVVHRDVKPGNIFCTDEGAMLADFGIAHWSDGDGTITRPEDRPGTPEYMAPEQFAGGTVTARADVYSAARVLFDAASGRRWQLAAEPGSADWSGVPADFVPALTRALHPSPAERWPDAGAFRAGLLSPPRSRRVLAFRVAAAAAILVALGAVAFAGASGGGPRDAGDRDEPRADFALLPFEEGDSAALGRRLALHTGLRLEWYPRWRMVPRVQSFAEWDSARALTTRPLHQLRGSLARHGQEWTLTIAIHGDSAGRLREVLEISGDPADEMGWARAVADSIVAKLFPDAIDEFRELEGGSTRSEPAALEYIRGTDAFRADNLTAAAEHYERALRIDPGFTQARWQLLLVRRWEREDIGADLRELYASYGHELPRLYASITAAQLEPDLRRRMDSLLAIQRQFGTRALAHFIAADELFHRGALVGIPLSQSTALLTERVAPDPFLDQASSSYHAAWGYIRLGDRARAETALARLRQQARGAADAPGRRREEFLRIAYDVRFRPALGKAKLWWVSRSSDPALLSALFQYVRLGLVFDLPEAQLRFADALVTHGRNAAETRQGEIARVLALLMGGRLDAGLVALDSAARRELNVELRLQQAEWRLVPELFELPSRPRNERERAMSELRSVADGAGPLGPRAAWTLALLALRERDSVAAASRHAQVHGDSRSAHLDRFLHAALAAAHGRPDSALALSEPLVRVDGAIESAGPFARSALFLARADWHRRVGAPDSADAALLWYEHSDLGTGWLGGDPHGAEVDMVMGVPARLRRAGLALARGDTEGACRHLARVRELWREADAAIAELLRPTASVACD